MLRDRFGLFWQINYAGAAEPIAGIAIAKTRGENSAKSEEGRMMSIARKDLGELTDIGAVTALLSVEGLSIVDVGCGPGKATRELCALGATVLGAEPDPIQAQKNREAPAQAGLTFIEAGAEKLPMESGSVDGVFFFRSLHHVPIGRKEAALAEAARVLKPNSGFLCVVEPAMTGTNFKVMRPFHDETQVRTEAQAALDQVATRLFRSEERYQYVQFSRYQNFEAMVARVTGQTFNSIQRESVETDEVRGLFEAGRSNDGEYVFDQPMLLNLFRGPVRS
jgi:ubiquinone/menaquinone biosynthesis C-methylase UbiE